MNNKKLLLAAVIIYFVSAGVSFAYFSKNQTVSDELVNPVTTASDGSLQIDPGSPKTETCPLNGALYTQAEREIWETRRPLAVMVENSLDARPQSGLIRADIVYEAVSEGGVTRFMPVYLCEAARSEVIVAPVRSVRTYYVDWASEYGKTPLFSHVLGANCSAETPGGPCKSDPRTQALEQLSKYGWRYGKGNDLDQAAIGTPTYTRKENRLFDLIGRNVATEHSMVTKTNLLWKIGKDRGWTNLDPEGEKWTDNFRSWKFKDEAPADKRGAVTAISHDFWSGYKQFDARWQYDSATNNYLRFTGGEPHKDLETGEQLSAKNVVILFTKELTSVDELKHTLYTTTGEGKVIIFQDGQAIEGKWAKKDRLGRTIFTTKKGEEIQFNPGRVWISVVGNDTPVTY